MVKKKKPFNVASLDASRLVKVDVPVVKNSRIETFPARNDKDVPLGCRPVVKFPKGSIKLSTLNSENVYLVDNAGKKVPATFELEVEIGDIIIFTPIALFKPGSKFSYCFTNGLRKGNGKKLAVLDNSISFTTAKE
jgi:hypothetical protein